MTDSNEKTVLDFIHAINNHDVEKIVSLMTDDHVFADTWGNRETRDEMRRGWPGYFAWFPDYRIKVDKMMIVDDTVAVFGYAAGTYSGGANPGSGKSWRLPAAWKAVVADGKIGVWQVYCDSKIPLDSMEESAAHSLEDKKQTAIGGIQTEDDIHFQTLTSGTDDLFESAFALYSVSFPEHEQRSIEKQCALMGNQLYHFDAIIADGVFAGIILYWTFDSYTYVEHFAIHPDLRGQAVGSKSMRAFCRNHNSVILEIDPPTDPLSIRRQEFYQKLGFRTNSHSHEHPAYKKAFSPHPLTVMSYPRELPKKEYRKFSNDLAAVVMGDS